MEAIIYVVLIGLSVGGILIHVLIKKNNFFKNLQLELNRAIIDHDHPKHNLEDKEDIAIKNSDDLEEVPYKILENKDKTAYEQLEKITQKITNNFRILITIHGILLGFIVTSQKIMLVFSSWYFVIWCGLILATVIKGAKFSIELSDILETRGIVSTKRKIFSAKKFYNAALIILIINVSLLPAVFLLVDNTETNKEFAINFHQSVLTASVSIVISFSLCYFFVFKISDDDYSFSEKNIVGLIILVIIIGALFYPISPVFPITVNLFGVSANSPLVLVILPFFGSLHFGVMIYKLIVLLAMRLPEKYKKIAIRISANT